ncbi:MAG: hypothetical protein V5A72_01585 [Candidatus Nanohaloarchaea archaeon]
MENDIISNIMETPLKAVAILGVLLFWILTPLIAQKYFGYSAINVSFGITVIYFMVWKIYQYN